MEKDLVIQDPRSSVLIHVTSSKISIKEETAYPATSNDKNTLEVLLPETLSIDHDKELVNKRSDGDEGEPLKLYHRIQGALFDHEFKDVITAVKEAIHDGIQPIRIKQGSSGSYFVRNKHGKIVGVFKPKDEEPYGQLNPKWLKWLHKTCFPCCFGRGCLMPNLGYISEAAASVLDRKLGLYIVPRTDIVELSSPVFHYSRTDRQRGGSSSSGGGSGSDSNGKESFPNKIGSFQMFLTGYRESTYLVRDFLNPELAPNLKYQFQLGFERLVILDYLMRNTDRGIDNWMIFFGQPEEEGHDYPRYSKVGDTLSSKVGGDSLSSKVGGDSLQTQNDSQSPPSSNISSWDLVSLPIVRIAGIDNGLAFPYKHPDEWRSYPYGWSWLPLSKEPFLESTIRAFLPLLNDVKFCEEIISELRRVFIMDEDFDEKIFQRQMALFRGQVHNLVEVLEAKQSPHDLIRKPLLMIYEDEEMFYPEPSDPSESLPPSEANPTSPFPSQKTTGPSTTTKASSQRIRKKWKKIFVQVKPFFTWW